VIDPNRKCAGIECGTLSPNGWCAGLLEGNNDWMRLKFAHYSDCLAGTAFNHELIHFFIALIENRKDQNHSDERFWSGACNMLPDDEITSCKENSVERLAINLTCQLTCGELCKD
jgi:hypothetical protein